MNKWFELLLGLILVIVPIWLVWQILPTWGVATVEFLKGGVTCLVILLGLLFLMLGISDLKE